MAPQAHNPRTPSLSGLLRWNGALVRDPQGRRCGTVVAPLVDREDGTPSWLLVRQRDGFRCVPVADLVGAIGGVHTPHTASQVRASCPVDGTGALSGRQEARLCAEYRVPLTPGATRASWERRRTTSLAEATPDGSIALHPATRSMARSRREDAGLSLLVASPDPEVGRRLRAAAQRLGGRLRVSADVRDGPAAIRVAATDPPDLAVLALELTLLDGPTTAARLRSYRPDMLIAFLSADAARVEPLDDATVLAPAAVPAADLLGTLERLRYGVGA